MASVLPSRPNLDHLRKQAKSLLRSYRSGCPEAHRACEAHLPRLRPDLAQAAPLFTLHDAQHVIARQYGFGNWADLRVAVGQTGTREADAAPSVLSPEVIAQFAQVGYVRVEEAFPRAAAVEILELMWSELQRMHGFVRSDPSSWRMAGWSPSPRPDAWTRLRLNTTKDHSLYQAIAAPRLVRACEQLLSPEQAAGRHSWGAFPVSFPERDGQPWSIPCTGWHVVPHVRLITFFSHVGPRAGARLLVEGSHHLFQAFCERLGPGGLPRRSSVLDSRFARSLPWLAELAGKAPDGGDRIRRFMEVPTQVDGVAVRVVALTGEPGDAVFCHAGTFQSSSSNKADAPSFMRG